MCVVQVCVCVCVGGWGWEGPIGSAVSEMLQKGVTVVECLPVGRMTACRFLHHSYLKYSSQLSAGAPSI